MESQDIVKNLQEQNKEIVKENEQLKKDPVNCRKKKNGQKKGHKGYTLKILKRIDLVKPLTIEKCPYCGNELSDVQEIRKRYVDDIPDALPNAGFGLNCLLLKTQYNLK